MKLLVTKLLRAAIVKNVRLLPAKFGRNVSRKPRAKWNVRLSLVLSNAANHHAASLRAIQNEVANVLHAELKEDATTDDVIAFR